MWLSFQEIISLICFSCLLFLGSQNNRNRNVPFTQPREISYTQGQKGKTVRHIFCSICNFKVLHFYSWYQKHWNYFNCTGFFHKSTCTKMFSPPLDPISFLQLSAQFSAATLAGWWWPESGAGLCQAPGWWGQAEAAWVPWTPSSQRRGRWEVPVHRLDLHSLHCKCRGSRRCCCCCCCYCCSCHGDTGCWRKDPQQAETRP